MNILVINCGSSSIKYQLLDMDGAPADRHRLLAKGLVERVGNSGSRLVHQVNGRPDCVKEAPIPNHRAGIDLLLATLADPEHGAVSRMTDIHAVGHRVVHAGERYTGSVLITPDVIAALRECIDLAPLHNPPNIAGIEACQECMPDIPHVAVFDNALHHTVPPHVYTYALPFELCEKYGIRRYGFHGIAFRSAISEASQFLGIDPAEHRIITMMLGSGWTANAMQYGKSLDVSTGFTPLEGLIQSTRTGDLDAAAVVYLMDKEGLSPAQMTDLLNKKSGWLGMTGVSQDLRDVMAARDAGDARAAVAIDAIAYRVRKYIGAYASAMGGVDLVIFTGGVGEKSPEIRRKALQDLDFMGVELDVEKNGVVGQNAVLTADGSRATAVTVVLNEELVIAQDTVEVTRAAQ